MRKMLAVQSLSPIIILFLYLFMLQHTGASRAPEELALILTGVIIFFIGLALEAPGIGLITLLTASLVISIKGEHPISLILFSIGVITTIVFFSAKEECAECSFQTKTFIFVSHLLWTLGVGMILYFGFSHFGFAGIALSFFSPLFLRWYI